jgi:hypothetical protein
MTWMKGFARQRGPITDYMEEGPDGVALCRCAHGKEWPEGDRFERFGGKACEQCVAGATVAREAVERPHVLAGDYLYHARTGRWLTANGDGSLS